MCIYKIFNITKETLENNGIEVIVDSVNALWLNEKNIEEKLGRKNLPAISSKYNKIYCNQNVLFVELKNQDFLKYKKQKVY